MICLLLLYLFCIEVSIFSAEKIDTRWLTIPITVTFPDDKNKTTTAIAGWSKTLTNALDDLGSNDPIPIHNVHKNVFDCLVALAVKKPEPVELLDFTQPIDDIKTKCALKLNSSEYRDLDRQALLVQANYLDVHANFKSALAYFYARTLTTKAPSVTGETVGAKTYYVFDNLPHELEPLVTGWLLHRLLRDKPTEQTKCKNFKLDVDNLIHGPFISQSSPTDAFAYIWSHTGTDTNLRNRMLLSKVQVVDFEHDALCSRRDFLHTDIDKHSVCCISHDKHYVLVTLPKESSTRGALIQIHHQTQKTHCSHHALLFHRIKTIRAALYNENTKAFNLVIHEKSDATFATAESLYFYSIDPNQAHLKVQKLAHFEAKYNQLIAESRDMDWSCIDGNLVGVYTQKPDSSVALLYTNNQLFECSYSKQKKLWTYRNADGQEHDAPFTVVRIGGMHTANGNGAMAIQRSCIPQFEQLVYDTYSDAVTLELSALTLRFDPNHLCYNYIKKSKKEPNSVQAKIKSLFSPQLTAAIQCISKKVLAGEKQILLDAYALYHQVIHPHAIDTYCGALYTYISPEIKEFMYRKI